MSLERLRLAQLWWANVAEAVIAPHVIRERLDYEGGSVRPPDRPGLGVTIDDDVLSRVRLDG